jgi:hypothetical protein
MISNLSAPLSPVLPTCPTRLSTFVPLARRTGTRFFWLYIDSLGTLSVELVPPSTSLQDDMYIFLSLLVSACTLYRHKLAVDVSIMCTIFVNTHYRDRDRGQVPSERMKLEI